MAQAINEVSNFPKKINKKAKSNMLTARSEANNMRKKKETYEEYRRKKLEKRSEIFTNQYYKLNFNLADTNLSESHRSGLDNSIHSCCCANNSCGSRVTARECMKHGKAFLS